MDREMAGAETMTNQEIYEKASEFEEFVTYAAKCVEEVLNTKIELIRKPFQPDCNDLSSWSGRISLNKKEIDVNFILCHFTDSSPMADTFVEVTLSRVYDGLGLKHIDAMDYDELHYYFVSTACMISKNADHQDTINILKRWVDDLHEWCGRRLK
jgi:hypothetical protein